MPISSNGSSLKVTTIVGDKTYDNEDYRDAFYGHNQQKEPSPHKPLVPDWRKQPPEATANNKVVEVDEKLQDAIDKDLSKRAIKSKTKTKTTN